MYTILFCELGSANFPTQPYKHEVPASFQIPKPVLWCRHTAMVVSSTEATRGCSQPEPRLHKTPSRDNITAAQICVSTTERGQCRAIMSCQLRLKTNTFTMHISRGLALVQLELS